MADKQESRREVAKRCVNERAAMSGDAYTCDLKMVDAIEAALKERDERAARICETGAPMLASPDGVIPAGDPAHERLQGIANILNKAAAAIRNEDTNG